MRDTSIHCPRCDAEANFGSGFTHFDGAEAKQLRKNPAVVGFEWGHSYMVVRYPKVLAWEDRFKRSHKDKPLVSWGICKCPSCGYLNKHKLNFPEEAYYQTEVAGSILWGWNRQDVCDLRDYLSAKDRRRWQFSNFIWRVPSKFKLAKHRDEAVKKLERLLKEK